MPVGNGHYSTCIEHNGLLYISGQLPLEDGQVPEGIEAQTRLVLAKLDQILQAADIRKEQVLQVRIYLSDIALWDQVNLVYADFFGEHKPARCVVPTCPLHYGCLIELEATAFTSKNEQA